MVDFNNKISTASVRIQNKIEWNSLIKAYSTVVEDLGQTINFSINEGFRYCRSLEEFTDGVHRYEIEVLFEGDNHTISFGVSYDPLFKCNESSFTLDKSYIYNNNNHSIFCNKILLSNNLPSKVSKIAVNINFDEKIIFFEIDGITYCKSELFTDNYPYFIIVGMYKGICSFIY